MKVELLCPDDINISLRYLSVYFDEQKLGNTILFTHYRNYFIKDKAVVVKENYIASDISQILNN